MDIITILTISAFASIMIGVVLLLKRVFKTKLDVKVVSVLWILVLIRLCVPVMIDSPLHLDMLIPNTEQVVERQQNAPMSNDTSIFEPDIATGSYEQDLSDAAVSETSTTIKTNKETQSVFAETQTPEVFKTIDMWQFAWAVWIIGSSLVLLVSIGKSVLFWRITKRNSNLLEDTKILKIIASHKKTCNIKRSISVWTCSCISMPMLIGVIRPKILLPSNMPGELRDEYISTILLHEICHIKSNDILKNYAGMIGKSLHWFNPLVWVAIKKMKQDMEFSCDAHVLALTDKGCGIEYCESLLYAARFMKDKNVPQLAVRFCESKAGLKNRVYRMVRPQKKSRPAMIIALLMAVIMTVACFTTACQPTPKKPVVIGKNDGNLEEKIEGNKTEPTAQTKPYEALERLNFEVEGLPQDYRIIFDAEVDVSDQAGWPVYSVEPAVITQEQADAVRLALLGDKVLYKPGKYRSHEEIERSIDYYQGELECSVKDGHDDLVDIYQGFLKDLYVELENTPKDIVLEEADTNFAFIESREMPELYGGKEVIIDEDCMRYEWTDEARKNAIEKGCEHIYGECWLDSGRKIQFSASNGNYSWGISLSVAEGDMLGKTDTTYSLDEAVNKADLMIEQMGLDFTLVAAVSYPKRYRNDQDEMVEDGILLHSLTYKRTIEGIPQDNIVSCINQSISEEEYRSAVMQQETITFAMDDYGINHFSWNKPMCLHEKEIANVELMPFDQVLDRIEQQLKMQTLWDPNDHEKEYIDLRRLEISKVKMSYMMVPKKNELESYYLIPVWNVCGDMYYHYTDSYDNRDETGGWILDGNHERNAWRATCDGIGDFSILTINAIDGSVIPRHRGR